MGGIRHSKLRPQKGNVLLFIRQINACFKMQKSPQIKSIKPRTPFSGTVLMGAGTHLTANTAQPKLLGSLELSIQGSGSFRALAFYCSTIRAQHLGLRVAYSPGFLQLNIQGSAFTAQYLEYRGPWIGSFKESDLAESGSFFADLFALFLSFTQLTTKINGDCHLKKIYLAKSTWYI